MKKIRGASDSFLLIGTQYLAWMLSMLLVFTSVTSWAGPREKGMGKAFKASSKVKINVTVPQGTSVSVRSRDLNTPAVRYLQRRIAETQGKAPALIMVNGIPFVPKVARVEQNLLPAKQELAQSPDAPKNLIQMYSRVKELLELNTPQTRKEAGKLTAQMVTHAQQLLEEAEQSLGAPLLYAEDIKAFLKEVQDVLVYEDIDIDELDDLYQSGLKLYNNLFPAYVTKSSEYEQFWKNEAANQLRSKQIRTVVITLCAVFLAIATALSWLVNCRKNNQTEKE